MIISNLKSKLGQMRNKMLSFFSHFVLIPPACLHIYSTVFDTVSLNFVLS